MPQYVLVYGVVYYVEKLICKQVRHIMTKIDLI
jgi:hypothetical protein